LSVPIIRMTAVEARKVEAIVELRSVWTPVIVRASCAMMCSTQLDRAARLTLTAWMVYQGLLRLRIRR
jgi:hypothetical protein